MQVLAGWEGTIDPVVVWAPAQLVGDPASTVGRVLDGDFFQVIFLDAVLLEVYTQYKKKRSLLARERLASNAIAGAVTKLSLAVT